MNIQIAVHGQDTTLKSCGLEGPSAVCQLLWGLVFQIYIVWTWCSLRHYQIICIAFEYTRIEYAMHSKKELQNPTYGTPAFL